MQRVELSSSRSSSSHLIGQVQESSLESDRTLALVTTTSISELQKAPEY